MPNRMIKDSIRTSKSVNALSDFQFRLWLYLITYVDDYGRGSADAEILKGFVFPRRSVTLQQIQRGLDDLATLGMINLYDVDGDSFLCFPNWDKHQRIQTKRSKYPEPQKSTVSHREPPLELETETELETELETESNVRVRETAFDRFWSAYPKKVGKEAARKSFAKVKAPIDTLLDAVEAQKRSEQWRKENGRFIPNPATWLNQGRWEDEIEVARPKGAPSRDYGNASEKIAQMEKMIAHMEGKG